MVFLLHLGERVHELNLAAALWAARGGRFSNLLLHRHDVTPLQFVFLAALREPRHQVNLVLRFVLVNFIYFSLFRGLPVILHQCVILVTLRLVDLPSVLFHLILVCLNLDHHGWAVLVAFVDHGLSETVTLLALFFDLHTDSEVVLAVFLFLVTF